MLLGSVSKIFGVKEEDYKIVRWETTDGESPINVFNMNVGDLHFNFNFITENETIVKYKSLTDVLADTGGLYVSIIGACLFLYNFILGKNLKKNFLERQFFKAENNEQLEKLEELTNTKLERPQYTLEEKQQMFEEMGSLQYNIKLDQISK